MKSLSCHLVSALLLAGMSSGAYAQPFQPNRPNFAQQQRQVAETVSRIQLANQRAQLLQQQSALLKQQQALEQQSRQAQAERAPAGQERARQQAEQYRAQKAGREAELQAELQNNRNDQRQAALAKEQLIAALQRQQEELIHQRSAATDLSTQAKLDAQMRQLSQESRELQTVQSR